MSIAELQDFRNHLADVAKATFIGSVVIYTVEDTAVPYATAKAELERVGLGDALPSSPPCDADVFRRVFFQGQRRRNVIGEDRVENLLVRDVIKSKERLVKFVVVEEVDQAGQRLSYDEALSIAFESTRPHQIEIKPLGTFSNRAWELAEHLRTVYMAERGCLDGNGVRTVIARALEACHSVSLRPGGGTYFTSSTFDAQIQALESLARHIPGAFVHSIPLIDDRKQRDAVRAAWQGEVGAEVEKLMGEISEVLGQQGEISYRKYQSFQNRYAHTVSKVNEYRGLLEENITDATLRLDILSKQVGACLAKVR